MPQRHSHGSKRPMLDRAYIGFVWFCTRAAALNPTASPNNRHGFDDEVGRRNRVDEFSWSRRFDQCSQRNSDALPGRTWRGRVRQVVVHRNTYCLGCVDEPIAVDKDGCPRDRSKLPQTLALRHATHYFRPCIAAPVTWKQFERGIRPDAFSLHSPA
jgi:hypothetical protein